MRCQKKESCGTEGCVWGIAEFCIRTEWTAEVGHCEAEYSRIHFNHKSIPVLTLLIHPPYELIQSEWSLCNYMDLQIPKMKHQSKSVCLLDCKIRRLPDKAGVTEMHLIMALWRWCAWECSVLYRDEWHCHGWVKALLLYVIWCGASSISIRKVSMGVSPMSLKKKRCSRHFRPMERRAGSRSSSFANLLKACKETDVMIHLV